MRRPRHLDPATRVRQLRATAAAMVGTGAALVALVVGLVVGEGWTQDLEADMARATGDQQHDVILLDQVEQGQ